MDTKAQVLTIEMASRRVKEYVEMKLQALKTGHQAKSLALNDKTKHWSYKTLDQLGRVGILAFKGMEVALFHARDITSFRYEDVDPIPEKQLQDINTKWIRVEFFHTKSSKEKNTYFVEREAELLKSVADLEDRNKQLRLELEQCQRKLKLVPQYSWENEVDEEIKRELMATKKSRSKEKLAPKNKMKKGKRDVRKLRATVHHKTKRTKGSRRHR